MKTLIIIVIAASLLVTTSAIAGSWSSGIFQGKGSELVEFGDGLPNFDNLKHLADVDARKQCPKDQPLERISNYQVQSHLIDYVGRVTNVISFYDCGTYISDHAIGR